MQTDRHFPAATTAGGTSPPSPAISPSNAGRGVINRRRIWWVIGVPREGLLRYNVKTGPERNGITYFLTRMVVQVKAASRTLASVIVELSESNILSLAS